MLDRVLFKDGIPAALYRQVRRAAGADRPQWPMEEVTVETKSGRKTFKVAPWAQVQWTKDPILIHPLTGHELDLRDLAATDIGDIKQRSFDHFARLIQKEGDAVDWRRTLFAYWRFGPELAEDEDNGKLGLLWPLLPADTRVPDHSIWDHLDLVSAFAGAFAADPEGDAALLALSLGPVQGFIAAARTTSDLWAGSHLLSRLAFEAVKVVCERLGPDAVLFPRLRGIPKVDCWLRDEIGLPRERFAKAEWAKASTDANPLFAAALPNRFVAVVPRSQAKAIAEAVAERVRGWLQDLGAEVADRLLEAAGQRQQGQPRDESIAAYGQMREQLEGFPEVHWAAVPFSLIRPKDVERQTGLDTAELSAAMAPFFGAGAGQDCGFLDSPAWRVLRQETEQLGGAAFFAPKPGTLYPAMYDLAERVMAAAKSARPFDRIEQHGWRCSLTGETEWLTTDRSQLTLPAGQRRSRKDPGFVEGRHQETLWTKVADAKPAWAKKGEHLGALPAIKRLWPTLFAEAAGKALGQDERSDRFVVSTHTMALAGNLKRLDEKLADPRAHAEVRRFVTDADQPPALPRSLAHLRRTGTLAARVPAALHRLQDSDQPEDAARLESTLKGLLGHKPEAYYALILMDGDRMGRMLSGDEAYAITYREGFHPKVREGFDHHAAGHELIWKYAEQKRAISPNRHLAISAALNDFALWVVPEVVEREHPGRVLYAGGDDVLAMLPVADLLAVMGRLRQAYSGAAPEDRATNWRDVRQSRKLVCKDGFAFLRGRLLRMLGKTATASCGAVVAHHQAPLSAVLRELRAAEQRAKHEGGRNAFSLALIKRSGGATHFTAKWGEPLDLLAGFRDFLGEPAVSRRAVYHSLEWLADLPDDADGAMLGGLLGYQFERQTSEKSVLEKHEVPELSQRLAAAALAQGEKWRPWLQGFLTSAEFLARETRNEAAAPAADQEDAA